MTRPSDPKPRIGEPLKLTPEEMDLAAIVTPVDVAQAKALWQQHAPPKLIDLLDAAPEAPR